MLTKCSLLLVFFVTIQFPLISTEYSYSFDDKISNDGRYIGFENEQSVMTQKIPIGLFADRNPNEMGIVFDYAIQVAYKEAAVSLLGVKEEVEYGKAFLAYKQLCRMMQFGVGAVFGPSSKRTAIHLMTACDAKDIPYIHSRLADDWDGFNLYPHPNDLAKALYSILVTFEWPSFTFLYENSKDLGILEVIIDLFGNNAPIISITCLDPTMNKDYRQVLRRIRKSSDKRVLVVGSTEIMPEFLRQAQQIGIINEDFQYIIGNLDFHSFNLEEYKYSDANITSLRMFSPEHPRAYVLMSKLGYVYGKDGTKNGSCPITMEMALLYDAIQVFAETTKHLTFRPIPLNCSDRSDSVRHDGSTFRNYMRSLNFDERTLSGRIYFEGNVRKGYTFDVVELQSSGIVKVGEWNENRNFTSMRIAVTNSHTDHTDNSLANKTFVVLVSVPNKPYASLVESYKKLEGNSQYEGYSVDLIKELSDKLGFNFTLQNGGFDYGSVNKATNTTTGMLKEIIEGRADLAITDLTITSEREEVIDFSIPFMNLGIAILFKKAEKAKPALFSFMDPFSSGVWWLSGFSFAIVSLSFFVLGRLAPTEWDNPFPCNDEPTELENQFTIGNSVWFTAGAILQQGSETAPKALSVRIVATMWWFFTLIMVSSYTANLAAFLTIETPMSLIENVKDLADNKGGVIYGSKQSGSTRNFFLTSEETIFRKMNAFMMKNPRLLTSNNEEGVERVKNSNNYAFLMESTSIEYNTVRECKLKKIGSALDEKGYGIAMRKNWPYRDKFNNALLELQEQGVLAKIKNKWWNEVGAGMCGGGDSESESEPLTMANLGGVYFVLGCGCGVALSYGFLKWLAFVLKKAKFLNLPFKQVFQDELKFVFDFHARTRIVDRTHSLHTYSRKSSISVDSIEPDTENNL